MSSISRRRVGSVVAALGAVWFVVLTYVVHAALPANPIDLPFQNRTVIKHFAPEGWAFFTKSPRTPQNTFYVHRNGTWESAHLGPVARPSNAFGLDRSVRAQGVEFGLLAHQINDKAWETCEKRSVGACLDEAPLLGTLQNESPAPTLCGTVGLVSQKPLPWSWRESRDRIEMPFTIAKVNVRCESA